MSLLPPDPAVLLAAHFGVPPTDLAPTFGGFSNLTVRATLAGRACVIKAATTPAKRADVQREAHLLPLLYAAGLPVPEPLAFLNDATWSVGVTAALPGHNGLHVLAETPAELPQAFAALGRILAAVHATPLPDTSADLDLGARVAAAHIALAGFAAPADLIALLHNALEHPLWRDRSGLVHGDSGLHNLLWSVEGGYLLDWEWAACGPALLDLAWLRWTLAWRALPDTLWDAACAAYGPMPAPLDAATQAALALGQIGLILARVADQPAARTEWLRRASWTRTLFVG